MHPTRRRFLSTGFLAAGLAAPAWADELAVPGSGNPEHVLRLLANAFNQRQNAHFVSVPPSIGTAGGLRDVESGAAPLGRIGRPLKDDERARGLVCVTFARDPVAFVAGAAVDLANVTTAQVLDVYRGKLLDWRELGAKAGPIRAIGREVTDASRQAIQRVIRPFESIVFADSVKMVHLDPQMIELLDRFPGSFGFLNRSGLAACATPVRALAFDGIAPTLANLESGRYPLWLDFGLVHRSAGPGAAGKAFLDFVRSPAGATLLRLHGVQPVVAKA